MTTRKNIDADLLNIVFLGSQDEVKSAFRQAGWHNADPVSKRAMLKSMYALLNNSGYPQQPMTTFLLQGKPEDMNWQKSLTATIAATTFAFGNGHPREPLNLFGSVRRLTIPARCSP